jgi:tetratricopeptide (TPR) repeat protein
MSRTRHAALLGALLLATAAAYLPCLDGEFLFDDEVTLKDALLRAPFEHGPAAWFVASRPVTLFTFALNHLATGTVPRGWHLTNLTIHLVAVVLAWLLVRRTLARAGLSEPELPALAATALFALHPLQTEAVAYLYQRGESLGSALYLLGLLLLLAWDEDPSPARRHGLLAGAALVQGVGLLTKPIVATLPAAWLLLAAIVPGPRDEGRTLRQRLGGRLAAVAPLLALSMGAAVRELWLASGSGQAGFAVPGLPPHLYLATQLRVIPTYLGLALWPAGQCADWTFPASQSPGEWPVLAGGLFLLAIAGAAVALAARAAGRTSDGAAAARAASFGLLFFFVALAPSSSLLPLLDPLAEHRTYLGLLGLALAAVAGTTWLLRRWAGGWARRAGWALALLLALALGLATARRAAVWTSMLTLWSDAASRQPQKARVMVNLGSALFSAGSAEEALAAYRRAWELQGDHTARPDEVLMGIVDLLSHTGRFDEARTAIADALVRFPGNANTFGLLAQVEWRASRLAPAEAAADQALRLDPGQPFGLKYLGMVRMALGDLEGARALLVRSAAAEPRDANVFLALGQVEERLGHRAAACAAYLRASGQPGFEPVGAIAQAAHRSLGCGSRAP